MENRRKVFFVLGLVLIFLAGICLLVWFVLRMSFFDVKSIEIFGLPDRGEEKLVANVQSFLDGNHFISRILGYDNIMAWKVDGVNFLKEHPEYEIFTLNRDFLNHKISILVKERERFGLWCKKALTAERAIQIGKKTEIINGGGISTSTDLSGEVTGGGEFSEAGNGGANNADVCWWFDKEGVAFSLAPAIESELFKRVEDFSNRELVLGDNVLPYDQFGNLLKVYEILDAFRINSKTLYLEDMSLQEVAVRSLTDPDIYFSIRSDPGFAAYVIENLKDKNQWLGLEYVDLRVSNRAYFK